MRSEKEMFDLILGTAREDERVRAVVMNGSRANRSIRKDCFQDYDIVYLVTELASFLADHSWIDRFGEIMILQTPNSMGKSTPEEKGYQVYLMQFMDGNRIDLTIRPIESYKENGEPAAVLLDKDGILPEFPQSEGECYYIRKPTAKEFKDCCNEFWWLGPYVAKELWRGGVPYSRGILEHYIRNEFMKVIRWSIGMKYNFAVGTGKMDKYLKEFLAETEWSRFEITHPDMEKENIWQALFTMGDMFREMATRIANQFSFTYPSEDDERVSAFLKHVYSLPAEAETIY